MASPPVLDDPNHSARRAKTRIAVAGVLLAIAIGGLTLLNRRQPADNAEVPLPQKQQSISSGESAPPTKEPSPTQITSQDQEPPPAPPVETPTPPPPPVEPPPPPQVTNPQPIKNTPPPAPPIKIPAHGSPVPSEPVAPSEKPAGKAAAAPARKSDDSAAQKPTPTPVPPAPLPAVKPGGVPRSFDVQVGVFTDMENAKQLQTKLAEHGIPSHTETKLQVGPFNTKAEADAAREKLQALGIGSVVVPGK